MMIVKRASTREVLPYQNSGRQPWREVLEGMNPASYRRKIRESTNWSGSRELFGVSGVNHCSCVVLLLASAAGGQKNRTDFGLLFLHPHARAADPPIGRSSFCGRNDSPLTNSNLISNLSSVLMDSDAT